MANRSSLFERLWGFTRDLRLYACGGEGLELVHESLSFDERRALSIPLGTFSPVPFSFAYFLATGHLTIFEPAIRTKPASANTTRTFA
jgi:hypothetical protein